MNKSIRSVCLVGAACLVSGCVSTWTLTEPEYLKKPYLYGLKLEQPGHWYRRYVKRSTLFTRNGLALEYILLESHKWSDTLTNGFTLPKDILLHEIPEIILGEYCARGYAFNLNVQSNEIVVIDSLPGTLTRYTLTAPNSLTKKGIMYCIPFKQFLTILTYEAEASHYFDRNVDEFTEVARSIMVKRKRYRALPGVRGREK